jgi:hypothetical protein
MSLHHNSERKIFPWAEDWIFFLGLLLLESLAMLDWQSGRHDELRSLLEFCRRSPQLVLERRLAGPVFFRSKVRVMCSRKRLETDPGWTLWIVACAAANITHNSAAVLLCCIDVWLYALWKSILIWVRKSKTSMRGVYLHGGRVVHGASDVSDLISGL